MLANFVDHFERFLLLNELQTWNNCGAHVLRFKCRVTKINKLFNFQKHWKECLNDDKIIESLTE